MASLVAPMRGLMEGCPGLPLWLPLSVVFGSIFDTFSSSWRPHCGAGAPIRRVPTPACGWWSSLGVPSSIHQERSDSSESCLWLGGNNQCVGHIPLPSPQGWQNCHNSNKFFHPVNVTNYELSSDSDLRLTESPRFTPPFLTQCWTN